MNDTAKTTTAAPAAEAGHNASWKTMARLLRVIELLSKPGGTNTREIAAEIGLSNDRDVKRTVLEALHRMGLRIEYPDEGSPGISHRYRLDRTLVKHVKVGIPNSRQVLLEPVLEPDEWMLLSFLLNSGGRLGEKPEVRAVLGRLRSKLAEVLADSSINEREREFAELFHRLDPVFEYLGQGRKLYADDIWETTVNPLAEAAARQRVCRVEYDSFSAGTRKTMDILPLRLVENGGSLYLLAMSAKYRNKVLPLEIGRFRSVAVGEESFDLPDLDLDGQLASTFSIFMDDPRRYRIRFGAPVARHIREREWAPGQVLEDGPDGSVVLDMETAGYPDVKHWVLSWGADALVLEPPELRADIMASLKASLAAYGD